jgi:hypothetical protein
MGLVWALLRYPQQQDNQSRRSQEGIPGRMGRAAGMSWEQLFFDPIELPDGRTLHGCAVFSAFIAFGGQ